MGLLLITVIINHRLLTTIGNVQIRYCASENFRFSSIFRFKFLCRLKGSRYFNNKSIYQGLIMLIQGPVPKFLNAPVSLIWTDSSWINKFCTCNGKLTSQGDQRIS